MAFAIAAWKVVSSAVTLGVYARRVEAHANLGEVFA
jgi:hypothetical protein